MFPNLTSQMPTEPTPAARQHAHNPCPETGPSRTALQMPREAGDSLSRWGLLSRPLVAACAIFVPASLWSQAAVSVKAPENGDRIVPGTPFVISASATSDGTNSGPVTNVEFFLLPNRGNTNAQDLPNASNSSATFNLATSINHIQVISGGNGYTRVPQVYFSGGGGSNAVAVATLSNNQVVGINVINGGSGYTSQPVIKIGDDLVGAGATANVSAGAVTSLTLTNGGSGYDSASPPKVTIAPPPPGTKAVATAIAANGYVTNLTIQNSGSGYFSAPNVTFSTPPAGVTATATAVLSNGQVVAVTPAGFGSGYYDSNNPPQVSFAGGSGTNTVSAKATAQVNYTNGVITNYSVTDGGSNYTSQPTVVVSPPPPTITAQGTAQINANDGTVTNITITEKGRGYLSSPIVTIADPPTGVTADYSAQIGANGAITNFAQIKAGSGYTTNNPPAVTIAAPAGGRRAAAQTPPPRRPG